MIALNGRTNAGPQPGRHLPRADDDGRLPGSADDHHARSGSTTATFPATRRSPSSSPMPRSPATCPTRAIRDRVGRHPDPRAGLVGAGHDHARAAGARASRRTCGPAARCDRPTSTWRCSTTASRSTRSPGWRRSGFCGLGRGAGLAGQGTADRARRRATGQPARRPALRRAARTDTASSTRRSPSCVTTPASARSRMRRRRSSPPAAARRRVCCFCSVTGLSRSK